MSSYVFFLLVLVLLLSVVAVLLLVKLSRRSGAQDEAVVRRIVAEQASETIRQMQMVREELTRTMREQLTDTRMELSNRIEAVRKEVAGNQALQLQQIQAICQQSCCQKLRAVGLYI